jgi:hypothetical protein
LNEKSERGQLEKEVLTFMRDKKSFSRGIRRQPVHEKYDSLYLQVIHASFVLIWTFGARFRSSCWTVIILDGRKRLRE